MPRTAKLQRNTKETQIGGELRIEGRGRYEISTGIRFFDHMLELFTKHGGFDLKLTAKGDLDVDQHHTVEDAGIVIGQLFSKALGDRKGINRAGYFVLPMDETLAVVAVDLGGRPALVYKDRVKVRLVGDLQTELVEDFFGGFVHHAGANLHAKVLYGRSNHHKIEAIFKCWARAMRYACSTDAQSERSAAIHQGALVIAIFDYGAGNLRSVQNTLDEIGATYELVRDAAGLERASKIILPGVGHFGQMLRALDEMNVRNAFIDRIRAGVPFLGICLGLQGLFDSSEEAPEQRGLGIFPGAVKRFDISARVPHMGWNQLDPVRPSRLLKGLPEHPYVYFAHSYYVPVVEQTAATCTYTLPYTAVLESGNIFGVQCHPEKSGPARPRHRAQFRGAAEC